MYLFVSIFMYLSIYPTLSLSVFYLFIYFNLFITFSFYLSIYRRPKCLTKDSSGTGISDRRPTCLVGDRHVWSETDIPDRKPSCLTENPMETEMPGRRPIGDRYALLETHSKYIFDLSLTQSSKLLYFNTNYSYLLFRDNFITNRWDPKKS